jgi:hypothetical protein
MAVKLIVTNHSNNLNRFYFAATGGLPPAGTNIKASEFMQ